MKTRRSPNFRAAAWRLPSELRGLTRSSADLQDARIGSGPRPRRLTIDHVVDLCENGFGYDGSLIIGAVAEMVNLHQGRHKRLKKKLARLQKRLKYGLPATNAIILYELGFSDRVVSMGLSSLLSASLSQRDEVIDAIKQNRETVQMIINEYPTYYKRVLERIIGE